jgi:hypothetical protein
MKKGVLLRSSHKVKGLSGERVGRSHRIWRNSRRIEKRSL